ncbi:restriction endonuclease subunit S [Paenibacillus sp. 32O-W]|uniref:restriction endonuclease subunit S n=1 Tax=Paenibacillus sp. 32O-W TaxID=1695218 RepID=UPI001642626B|nr:restriction endonuclease subunit S [Paenibacillus sp. 32O-W]
MSFEWKEVRLSDIAEFANGKKRPSESGKIPVYGGNGIMDYTNSYNSEGETVIIGRVGAYCGNVHYENQPCWISDNAIAAKPCIKGTGRYLYYKLKSMNLYNMRIGSSQPLLTQSLIKDIVMKIPSTSEQIKISDILTALDYKIELNNAINKNLEEMAQAIFKRWFVDFEFPNENGEPYKSSGGEFEESELGLIPRGWSVGTFQDLISDTVGGDWGKEAPQGNYTKEVSCIRGADIPEITKGLLGKVPKRFILPKNATAKSLSHGDIIIEISGGSPTQSTGRSVLIIEEVLNKFNTPLICTNFCRVIKPIIGYSEFLYCYLSYLYNEDVFFQYENGTTGIKNLDIGSLLSVHKIVIPIKSVLQQYSAQYQAVYSTIQHLGRESDQLAQIRDTLLPKLISGEIRVPVEQDHSAPDLPMVAESSATYQP